MDSSVLVIKWQVLRFQKRVQFLIDSERVDVNEKDKGGRTALVSVVGSGYLGVVQILLNTRGIDIDGKAMSCNTAPRY